MKINQRHTKKILIALTIALILSLSLAWVNQAIIASGPVAQIQTTGPTMDEESLPVQPALLKLSWDKLPQPDAVTTGAATAINLQIRNLTDAPVRVELRLAADNGGQRSFTRKFGDLNFGPKGSGTLPINLRDFGFDWSQLVYSGQLQAIARIYPTEGDSKAGGPTGQAESPTLFFHPATAADAQTLMFYGEQSLQKSLRAGDFRGRVSRELFEPEADGVSRVLYGGGGVGESPTQDEPEETPEPDETVATQRMSAKNAISAGTTMASGNNYRTCVKFQIRTVDSGLGIPNGANAGGTEDHYINANNDISVIARGVRVKVSRGGWSQTIDSEPTTGCFNWSHNSTSGFSLRVYGYATDSADNYVRIHTSPTDFSSYPGQTYSILLTDVSPTPGGVNTYHVGSYNSKWTAMASLAFGLARYHDGLSDKAFHVAMDDSTPGKSSAHFGQSNSNITNGRHYLKIGNASVNDAGDPATPQTRYKFIVAHELGHAIAAIYYGDHDDAVNGSEPSVSLSHNVNPNACGTQDDPANDKYGYSIDSKEWNSLGFREGFAHFVAAKIWNNKETEGTFSWFADPHDLERYNYGANNEAGGRLENQCCAGGGCAASWDSAGTNGDWLRFFWDWYTNTSDSCDDRPTKRNMLKLYRQTRLNGGLTSTNYFAKMQAAADDLNLANCLKTSRFNFYAAHNGIDNE
jgi:hypothetical protein